MESVHEKLDKYRCNSCPKSFTLPYSLKRHVASVHGGGDARQFQCDICSKTFSLRDALKRHRERVHKLKGGAIDEQSKNGDVFPARKNHSMALAPPPVRLGRQPQQQVVHQQQQQFQQLHGRQQLSIPTAYVRPPPPGGFAFGQNPHHFKSDSRKGTFSTSSMSAQQAISQATALLSHIRQPVWPT